MANKKFLAAVVASALVATSMTMPAMAADTGSVDIDVTLKTGVVRVEVPTNMAVAIDQFEITQAGAQIASGTFDMVNKSEMNVKVDVKSTVTLGNGVVLAPDVETVSVSEGDAVAWLGVAAQTAEDSYDDAATSETENYWDLTEANANVTTFVTESGVSTAEQTFYLGKSVSGNDAVEAVYTMSVPKVANEANQSYAQYFELTKDTSVTNQATLATLLATKDVYTAATGVDTDETPMEKIEKGSAATFEAGLDYYTAAAAPTAATALSTSKKYVYATMQGEGGKASFTYVGKLANKTVPWTASDISKIKIDYTITGVTATVYDDVKGNCTYGLYSEQPVEAAPSIAVTSYTLVADRPVEVAVSLGGGTLAATTVSKVTDTSGNVVAQGTQWSYANGKVTFTTTRVNALLGAKVDKVYTIHFDDAAKTKVNVTLKGSGN